MPVISLEPANDPSLWLPQNSSSIGILSTPSKEKASPDSKIKSSGMVSKGTVTSEPISGTFSTTGSRTSLEDTRSDVSWSSQTTSSFRKRMKMLSSLTSTSATKTGNTTKRKNSRLTEQKSKRKISRDKIVKRKS